MISCKLRDICKLVKGKQIDTSLLAENLPFKYINGGVKESGYYEEYNTNEDTIIISEGGASCGYVNYITEKFWLGCHCYKLIDVSVDSKYLYYALKANQQRIMELRTGAAMPNIKKTVLSEFPIKISMDETEQKQIVKKLDYIEHLLEIQNTMLLSLDGLTKSRFMEMFGDCIENPKGWKLVRLNDIAVVGSSRRVFVEELKEEGIPFFRGTEIGSLAEGQSIAPELFITVKHYLELCEATGKPQIGDLLMPSICPDGRIWLVNTELPFYFKDGRVLWVHSLDEQYNPTFLLYMLKDRITSDYSRIASGTTFAELKIFELKKCLIFDVPTSLQNEFASFVEQVDKSKYDVILRIKLALFELIHSQKLFFVR